MQSQFHLSLNLGGARGLCSLSEENFRLAILALTLKVNRVVDCCKSALSRVAPNVVDSGTNLPSKRRAPDQKTDRAPLRGIALAPVGDGPTHTDKGQIRKRGGQRRPGLDLIRCAIKLSNFAAKFNAFLFLTVTLS